MQNYKQLRFFFPTGLITPRPPLAWPSAYKPKDIQLWCWAALCTVMLEQLFCHVWDLVQFNQFFSFYWLDFVYLFNWFSLAFRMCESFCVCCHFSANCVAPEGEIWGYDQDNDDDDDDCLEMHLLCISNSICWIYFCALCFGVKHLTPMFYFL